MPRPPGAHSGHRPFVERRGEVDAEHVVPAVMVSTGPRIGFAARVGAGLAPAVVRVAAEEAVVHGEVVIDAQDARRVGVEPRVLRRKEVVAGRIRGRVRFGHVPQQVEGHRVHPVSRNHIAGEGLRHAVHRIQRVVDGDARLREVSGALQSGRRTLARADRDAGLEPFVRVEEERPVLLDRPADRPAGVVVKNIRLGNAAHDVLVEVRVQRGVAVNVVAGPMELVRAAPDRDGNRAAAGASELGVVGARRDPDFLHRVGRRDEGETAARAAFTTGVRRAIQRELVAAGDATVDGDAVHAAVVEGPQLDALAIAGLADHAGHDMRERERIPPRAREVLDQLLSHHLAPCRGRRLEQRRLGGDPDFFGHRADRQRHVHAQPVAGAQFDFPAGRAETRQRERHAIAAVHQRGQEIDALLVGHDGGRDVGVHVDRRRRHPGQHSALVVFDRPGDGAELRLRGRGRRAQHQRDPDECRQRTWTWNQPPGQSDGNRGSRKDATVAQRYSFVSCWIVWAGRFARQNARGGRPMYTAQAFRPVRAPKDLDGQQREVRRGRPPSRPEELLGSAVPPGIASRRLEYRENRRQCLTRNSRAGGFSAFVPARRPARSAGGSWRRIVARIRRRRHPARR